MDQESYYEQGFCEPQQQLYQINGSEITQLPHCAIGAIAYKDSQGKVVFGSGVALSPNIVLTAASNIFNTKQGCDYSSLSFYLETNGKAKKQYLVASWRYPSEYKVNCSAKFNYALVKLKGSISFPKQFPHLSLSCQTCTFKENEQYCLQVFGYPWPYKTNDDSYKSQNQEFRLHQYGLAERSTIISIAKSQIEYHLHTRQGQEGSPLILNHNIIGIHHQSQSQQSLNFGRIIDLSLFTKLKEWCEQLNGETFQIEGKDLCPHLFSSFKEYQQKERRMKQESKLLNLSSKKLKSIKITQYTNLTLLSLSNNQLSAIDVTKNTNLTHLSLYNNQLSAIDVTKNTNLTHLDLNINQLSAIDVTKNTNLNVLNLYINQLSAIDVTKNTNLTDLSLYNNQLSAIDVTKNTNLTHLYLGQNQLSAIDVTKNTNLTHLSLYNNQLSAIDVTKNTKLTDLYLQNNRLDIVSLSFVASKPIEKYLDSFYFNFSDQLSAFCEILIYYNSADKYKCSELKERWAKKYGDQRENKHGCKYALSAVQR